MTEFTPDSRHAHSLAQCLTQTQTHTYRLLEETKTKAHFREVHTGFGSHTYRREERQTAQQKLSETQRSNKTLKQKCWLVLIYCRSAHKHGGVRTG